MNELSCITIALLITFLGSELAHKFKYPRVIGQLVISFILAIPFIKEFFTEDSIRIIHTLSELGVLFLLLLTGFKIDLHELNGNKKDASVIAIFAAVIPFLLGMGLAKFLGYSLTTGFVLGACMAVTAEGTKVAILLEMKKIKTRLANIMLGAGILDDIFEILFLGIIVMMARGATTNNHILLIFSKFLAFILFIYASFKLVPHLIAKLRNQSTKVPLLRAMIIIGLSIAVFSEFVGLGAVLGAFIAGIILQKSFFIPGNRDLEAKNLELFSFAFIVPFFFVSIGLNFDYQALINNPLLTLSVLGIATGGKLIGTFAAKPFTNLTWTQLNLTGWGMNSRGVMELILAQLAFSAGLINVDLYSAIVFMAITTTTIFPFAFRRILKKHPDVMN